MVTRTILLILAIVLATLFLISGGGIAMAMHRGYGLELQILGICAVSGTFSLICLGVWLFLRSR